MQSEGRGEAQFSNFKSLLRDTSGSLVVSNPDEADQTQRQNFDIKIMAGYYRGKYYYSK